MNQEKDWKKYNRTRKKQQKKWKEERLLKKMKRDHLQKAVEDKGITETDKSKMVKRDMPTISIAIPGSILDNAQSSELRANLAGQIARAACIYKVDEIIVFDDQGEITESEKTKIRKDDVLGEGRICCIQLARILQYLECPQYLRKYFFPIHADLQYAGVLNPLVAPHHLKQQDVSLYREGVVTNKPVKTGNGSQVNVGLFNDVHVDKILTEGLRVTIKIPPNQENPKRLKGIVVSPSEPRLETGIYWGYNVKLASHISDVLNKCSYKGGYDLTIGTSDKGISINEVDSKCLEYHHALIVFGGLSGLESAIELDPNINVDDASSIFDKYLNLCPDQGSGTIRTEEALLLSLAVLKFKLVPKFPALPNP